MGFWSRLFGTRKAQAHLDHLLMTLPFEVEAVPGHDALDTLRALRRQGAAEGITPIVLGGETSVIQYAERLAEHTDSTDDILRKVASIGNPEWWFTARLSALEECLEDTMGEWPDACVPQDSLCALNDPATETPWPTVYIAKLHTAHAWQAPALLQFGGWNECPFPEEHAAIARYWQERYGAEPVAMTGDTLECFVSRPPTTREAAEQLALEQFAYCEDIVIQGTESVRQLAASLLNAPSWFFWWD